MFEGLVVLPWWGYVILTLVLTHCTIISVTLYLHRCQAHCALELHPALEHLFRFWLWATTGMITKEWVAVHRKHHANTETADDPHSPQVLGIGMVFWQGSELYRTEATDPETLRQYGHGTPDDWLERNLYSRVSYLGVLVTLMLNLALFGTAGILIWAVQMLWIPVTAAGVVNGFGHYWGYRNFETPDGSTNVLNLGVIIGGEELHNNHHAYPGSAKFSSKRWEVDTGWLYIRLLSFLRLAKVRRRAPQPVRMTNKDKIDLETAKAIIASKLHVMADYKRLVTLPTFRDEWSGTDVRYKKLMRHMRAALVRENSRLKPLHRKYLQELLQNSDALQTVYEFRSSLQQLWNETYASHERLVQAIAQWCKEAEATGIRVLQRFAQNLRSYALQPGTVYVPEPHRTLSGTVKARRGKPVI